MVGKSERKGSLWRPMHRRENTVLDLTQVLYESKGGIIARIFHTEREKIVLILR